MLRRVPRSVIAYTVLVLGLVTYNLAARDTKLWHQHPGSAVAVIVIGLAWLAAVVVFRQRWAWALVLLGGCLTLVEPVWEKVRVWVYVVNLVQLALLLSPGMRAWVRWRRPKSTPASEQPTFGPEAN
jgi:hypothetical protein